MWVYVIWRAVAMMAFCECSMTSGVAGCCTACVFGVLLSVEGLVTAMRLSTMHIQAWPGYDRNDMSFQVLSLGSKTDNPRALLAGAQRKGF